jgi:hypothetical protein|tara:strand:+ start:303 stop:665 length:363 start_codon:yes stop_codon:yes gene_type:complete
MCTTHSRPLGSFIDRIAGTGWPGTTQPCLEAGWTIARSIMGGLERQPGIRAATGADSLVGLPPASSCGTMGDGLRGSAASPTFRASNWLVRKTLARVGGLLDGGVSKSLAALAAGQHEVR